MSLGLPRTAGFLFCFTGTVMSWLFGVLLRPSLLRGELWVRSAAAWQFFFSLLVPTLAITLLAMHWLPRSWRIPLGVVYTAALVIGLAGV